MNVSIDQIGFGAAAVLAVALIIVALWVLLSLLIKVGKFATVASFSFFIGILVGIIVDIRLMLLSTGILTLLGYYQGGNWKYLASIFSIESLSLSGLYVFSFLTMEISKKEDRIIKEIQSVIKGGAGLWGVVGVVISFSICCFIISSVWKVPAFSNVQFVYLSFYDCVKFALQIIIEMVPVINLEKSFGWKISGMTVRTGYYWVGGLVFVYQLILTLSLTQVIVFFWNLKKTETQDDESKNKVKTFALK